MFKNALFAVILLMIFGFESFSQFISPPFLSTESERWADSVLRTMNRKECIGQLFMISAYSNKDSTHVNMIDSMIQNYNVGGLIFFQGGPLRQANLTNRYQAESKIPLLISIDGEWGLSMRLDSTLRFPRQMTLGAMMSENDIYAMGAEIARQCKLTGIHINFAPCVDINNNPLNPVINSRSFGENKNDVARKGLLYMKGLQDNGVLACAKHFPGHGNTESDSHFTLPIVNQPADEIDSVELFPFKSLIKAGLGSVMVAHLNIPALDSSGRPSSLSQKIVTSLLRDSLKFNGLIFTDALGMKGVANDIKPGEIELNALKAGNDILLCSENTPLAIEMIDSAMIKGELDSVSIFGRVKKILQLKYWCGLNKRPVLDLNQIENNLYTEPADFLIYKMYRNAVTVLKNRHKELPWYAYKNEKTASLVINDTCFNTFQTWLNRYGYVDCYRMSKDPSKEEYDSIMNVLCQYQKVVLSIHNTSTLSSRNFNITSKMDDAIYYLHEKVDLTTVVFGNAYTLSKLPHLMHSEAVILAYEDSKYPNQIAAQLLFGGVKPTGKLPVSPTEELKYYDGIVQIDKSSVVSYTMPEEFGLSTKSLSKIDSIAQYAISSGATPGCQIAVLYRSNFIYEKSFGNYTYNDSVAVNNNNLYDIASVTKIASTALAAMYLYDKGKIDLNKKLSKYLPELRNSNKKDILIKDIMTHQAGLKAWIPFYKETIDSLGVINEALYKPIKDSVFKIEVADSLYLRSDYTDSIYKQIINSPVDAPGKYVYSDLGMILMQHLIESITQMPIDSFVSETFYKPMALKNICYLPLEHFSKDKIIPTEYDSLWRHQLIHGHVHDMAAAMFGGVSGHAGVFSNAESLAILMQMLMQNGFYGGKQYIKAETVKLFTSQFYPGTDNRRGLFFDKPEPDKSKNGPTAKSASSSTYGHTGFTGTCAWADPDMQLVYVFLSNRVYPSANNNKLANLNIRTDIMQAIYNALKSTKK